MPLVSAMPAETDSLLENARSIGFDKLIYTVDLLDGDIDPPLEAISSGVSQNFWERYLDGLRQDVLRRMVARGEIPIGNTPWPGRIPAPVFPSPVTAVCRPATPRRCAGCCRRATVRGSVSVFAWRGGATRR